MSSMFERYCSIFNIIYEIKKEKLIKIFDTNFVFNNKRKSKMIINNKIYSLSDKYQIIDDNTKFLKIKLLIINREGINLSYMLNDCKSLKKFYIIKEEEQALEDALKMQEKNTEDEIIKKFDVSELNSKLSNQYYQSNKTYKINNNEDKSSIKRKKIYFNYSYLNNNNISDYENEKINENYIRSFEYVSPLSFYYSCELQNNNKNENNSFKTTTSKIIKKESQNKSLYDYFYLLKLSLDNTYKRNSIIVSDLSYMFHGCSSLIFISGISKWNTSNVTNISHMFEDCSSLKILPDLSQWKMNKVTNVSKMFSGCASLKSIPDISKWNTESVKNMNGLFCNCSKLELLPDISEWNIENANYLSGIFLNCSSLISLPDISKWNTSNAIFMNGMFYDCSSLF